MPLNWITNNFIHWRWPLILTVSALVVAIGDETWRNVLRYDRALLSSQWWRWLSAHIVHASWSHTLMNISALWVIWLLFSKRLTVLPIWPIGLITIICLATMNAGFWFRDEQLMWYVGMSGLLHGYFAAGALDEALQDVHGGLWLLLGLIAKLGYEQINGALPLTEQASGAPVWVNSHLYGAIGGLVAVLLIYSLKKLV